MKDSHTRICSITRVRLSQRSRHVTPIIRDGVSRGPYIVDDMSIVGYINNSNGR